MPLFAVVSVSCQNALEQMFHAVLQLLILLQDNCYCNHYTKTWRKKQRSLGSQTSLSDNPNFKSELETFIKALSSFKVTGREWE